MKKNEERREEVRDCLISVYSCSSISDVI